MINENSSRDEVLAVVKEDGVVLQFASEDLRGDKEVVLEAVKENGWILGDAHSDLRQHPLLNSIAEETQLGKKQNISYELFCFAEKPPAIYFFKLYFLTSKEIRSACNTQNAVSSGNTNQFVFNFAKHQLDNSNFAKHQQGSSQDELDNQKFKP